MGVTVNGVELEWRERGDGDVVVFIHGFPFNSAMWGHQLAAMPPDWRAIAPDLRGFGASDIGDDPVFAMDLFARDLAALLDHLNIERVVLCGHWRLCRLRVLATACRTRSRDRPL
jgi:pimeloyl-ACP methyl ester carboxylesterase